MKRIEIRVLCLIIGLFFAFQTISAQTTAFVYQGSLKQGGTAANGNFDFEFLLCDAATGGFVLGTQVANNVAVTNGVFSASLDFGLQFTGENRFLEIHVRQSGGGAFTVLTPRQQVNSSPYSIKSLLSETTNNALSLGGISANQYITTSSGGANFIQNSTSQQASSNFNISGNGIIGEGLGIGTAPTTRLQIQHNNAALVFGNPSGCNSDIAGIGLTSSLTCTNYTIAGSNFSGLAINRPIGFPIDFRENNQNQLRITTGGNVGIATTSPQERLHVNGNGLVDGNLTVNGTLNAALPVGSGNYIQNTTTSQNANFNISGNGLIGGNIGIGTAALFRLDVADRIRIKQNPAVTGSTNSAGIWFFQTTPNTERAFIGMENDNSVGFFGQNGGGWGLVMNTQTGVSALRNLGLGGATQLCRNASNEISTCSSSLRYKTNISSFSDGLAFINRLRPISFDWRDGGIHDVGFGAEEVARINPLFVSYNEKGEVEGVKYDRLSVAFVNAFKEQQTQIDTQQKQINEQKSLIQKQQETLDALKQFICSQNASAALCQ